MAEVDCSALSDGIFTGTSPSPRWHLDTGYSSGEQSNDQDLDYGIQSAQQREDVSG